DPLDFPTLKLVDNFRLGAPSHLQRMSKATVVEAIRTLRDSLGFQLDLHAYVDSLSVGQRQQAEILRLLWHGADVLILDEPATGISSRQKETLFHALRTLVKRQKTVLLVSHKLEDVEQLSDEIVVLRKGRVAGELSRPYHTSHLIQLMFGNIAAKPAQETRGQAGPCLLEIRDLAVEDTRTKLQGLSLELREREIIGLAGTEGSGQTLFLKTCAGLIPPLAGTIRLRGRDRTGSSPRTMQKEGVRYIPAARLEEGLIRGMSLVEHVILTDPLQGRFIHRDEAINSAIRRMNDYDIKGTPDTLVEQLSGGNQQRALLSLLPEHVQLILAEHPTRGLDIEYSAALWGKLKARCEKGAALIFISSDLEELLEYSHRILVFSAGCVMGPLDPGKTSADQLGQMMGGKERVAS
ncbi:MAG: ATP-binding cassette domain-containing protein, partial [Lentisphaerota bacterium]